MRNSLVHPFVVLFTIFSALTLATGLNAAGPQSQLFLTAGDQQMVWVVQGPSVVNSWTEQHQFEYALAVDTGVRTLGRGTGEIGALYSLTGTFTGINYAYPLGASTNVYDSTSDGMSFNYLVDFNSGNVYSTNFSWANPTYLFTGSSSGFLGITFDPTDSALWLSNFNGTTIEHRSLFGTLLSSFTVPFTAITCLALDPRDNTLWMGTQGAQGSFYQYSKAGVQLSSVFYPALAAQNTLGGEFVATAPTVLQVDASAAIVLPSGKKAAFQIVDVENEVVKPPYLEGVLAYQDKGARVSFQTGKITSVTASGNEAQIKGIAKVGKQTVNFTIQVLGNQSPSTGDTFSISLSNGYTASGNIAPNGFISVKPEN